jgi:DNA polymerase-3 subunit epsilon
VEFIDHPVRYKRWKDVPDGLLSKTALKEKGMKPGPIVRGTIFINRRNLLVELFHEKEAIPREPASPSQLSALVKARAAQEVVRTCPGCQQIFSFILKGCICEYCKHEIWLDQGREFAKKRFIFWMENQKQYVVLDLETTGLDDDAEIVEIAIVDLDETVIFHSLIRPERPIPEEAVAIHGITNEMVTEAPTWAQIWPQVNRELKSRTVLIYNDDFDKRVIYNACRRCKLSVGRIQSECVMKGYAQYRRSYNSYHRDYTWIGLEEAVSDEKVATYVGHRAVGDCLLTVQLIRKVAEIEVSESGSYCI